MTPPPASVRSKDGTAIGFLRLGTGPPLVMVHGSLAVAEAWLALANLLADSFTCYLMDRRGRGRSGDAPDYAIEREYEDIVAILAAVGPSPISSDILPEPFARSAPRSLRLSIN